MLDEYAQIQFVSLQKFSVAFVAIYIIKAVGIICVLIQVLYLRNTRVLDKTVDVNLWSHKLKSIIYLLYT